MLEVVGGPYVRTEEVEARVGVVRGEALRPSSIIHEERVVVLVGEYRHWILEPHDIRILFFLITKE